jgi:hypothetical protein
MLERKLMDTGDKSHGMLDPLQLSRYSKCT